MSDNREPESSGNPWVKSLMVWGGIFLALLLIVSMFGGPSEQSGTQIKYSDFRARVAEGNVREVTVAPDRITGTLKNDSKFTTTPVPDDTSLTQLLESNDVQFTGTQPEQSNMLVYILIQTLPFLLILGIAFFALAPGAEGRRLGCDGLRQVQGQAADREAGAVLRSTMSPASMKRAKSCRRSSSSSRTHNASPSSVVRSPRVRCWSARPAPARRCSPAPSPAKRACRSLRSRVRISSRCSWAWARARVRDMFEQAKKNAPCIVFIDEIDAVGRHRGHGLGNSNDEREQTLNQLLVEMDGFEANEGIIIIAATNRPDVLDPALLRPGRFDRQVVVPVPDIDGREKILAVHMKKVPLAPDVNPRTIARGTPGFSGADLANLVNEAALLAARRNKRLVAMKEFEDAKDKVMMGSERKSMVMTDDEKKMTAYHEAGHAIVAVLEAASDPIHKATIIPRGRALGMVMRLPERDNYSYHRDKMHANLSVSMGGRVAEEIIFGHDKVSSGAASDIQYATDLARNMVTRWGMSDRLGPLQYEASQEGYLGMGQTQRTMASDETNKLIDAEIRGLVDGAHAKANQLLSDHEEQLHLLAQALLEYETLTGDEIKALLENGKIDRPDLDPGPVASKPVHGSSIPRAGKRFAGDGAAPQGA